MSKVSEEQDRRTGRDEMRQALERMRLGLGVLLLMSLGIAIARAQDAEPQAGAAFTGGQMVRGTVTATAADRLTVKTEAGEVYQIALSANTRVTKERQPFKVADIKVGDGVGAMGVLDGPTKTVHAVFVGVVDAEQVKKAREGMGKVYISGKVTAIDDVKLTVLRPDGISQVIEVDEGTSFKRGGRGMMSMMNGSGPVGGAGGRVGGAGTGAGNGAGGESITLADVKVGDTVVGPGALKNGVFVPTQLGVMDAAMMAQRRRRAAEGSAAGTAAAGDAATAPAAAPAPIVAPKQ